MPLMKGRIEKMKSSNFVTVVMFLIIFSFVSAVIADNAEKEVIKTITPQTVIEVNILRTLEESHRASEYQHEVLEKTELYKWYAQNKTGDPKVRTVIGDMPVYSYRRGERNGFKSRLMIMWRLVDYLSLDEDTATRFFPLYREYMKTRESLMKDKRALTKKISKNADDESVPVKDLKKDIAKLFGNEKSLSDARKIFYKKSEKILSDRQYVKLIIFSDKLKEDLFSRFRTMRTSEKSARRAIQTDVEKRRREGIERRTIEKNENKK